MSGSMPISKNCNIVMRGSIRYERQSRGCAHYSYRTAGLSDEARQELEHLEEIEEEKYERDIDNQKKLYEMKRYLVDALAYVNDADAVESLFDTFVYKATELSCHNALLSWLALFAFEVGNNLVCDAALKRLDGVLSFTDDTVLVRAHSTLPRRGDGIHANLACRIRPDDFDCAFKNDYRLCIDLSLPLMGRPDTLFQTVCWLLDHGVSADSIKTSYYIDLYYALGYCIALKELALPELIVSEIVDRTFEKTPFDSPYASYHLASIVHNTKPELN